MVVSGGGAVSYERGTPVDGWLPAVARARRPRTAAGVAISYGNTHNLSTLFNAIYYTGRSSLAMLKQTCGNAEWNQVYKLQVFPREIDRGCGVSHGCRRGRPARVLGGGV